MEDVLLQKFFEFDRWQAAIAKGILKDVPKADLYQLCKPETRMAMYEAIRDGKYEIAPPHTALIPKDTPGEYRTVYVNEPADRILLSIVNDLLFELMPDKVHPACKSYLKGIGCGKVVQEVSRAIMNTKPNAQGYIGWKSDLSKYFDSVPIEYIDGAFDMVEERYGHSAIIDVLRKYYHSDVYITPEGEVAYKYQSLKQGCSVASWLADVLLYHIDEKLSALDMLYIRYSDDMLGTGNEAEEGMQILSDELEKMQMKLNPKKVEWLSQDKWFKFLGFSIKGASLSISKERLKTFQREIEARTVRHKDMQTFKGRKPWTFTKALNAVNRYLYHGDGQGHSWATGILSVVNVREDIDTMNTFVMDALRAVYTGKKKIGGLGYDKQGRTGCVVRGKGRNVTANRQKTGDDISGYISLGCMQNALRTSHAAYDALVRTLMLPNPPALHPAPGPAPARGGEQTSVEVLEDLYAVYKHSIPSERTMNTPSRFYSLPESELSDDDMLYGVSRETAERDLEKALQGFTLPEGSGWFWQSPNDPDLVVLRAWCQAA